MEEIHFEICHSGNLPPIEWYALAGSGLQNQRAAAVDEQRAACSDRSSAGIPNCWRSELGAQSDRENHPACYYITHYLLQFIVKHKYH